MADDNAPRWFAVRTATRREADVIRGLAEMPEAGDYYLPLETRWGPYKRDGKTREVRHRPLLVGYLFVQMTAQDVWLLEDDASKIPGVYSILTHRGDNGRRIPTAIPGGFVEKLRAAQDGGKFDCTRGKSRARGVERSAWKKLSELATMTEEDRLRALASFLGLKVEPEAEVEPDYGAAMEEKRAA